MKPQHAAPSRQVERPEAAAATALYWDFENLHASLCEARTPGSYSQPDNRFKVQEPLVDVLSIISLAASFGPLAINRAYCNWQYFGRYREALLQNGIDLVQMFPPGGTAKNGADIRLALDAVEDAQRFAHIGTVIVVAGDSDFMPLAQKLKAAGKTLVGVGARKHTNDNWARSCHQFHYYEELDTTRENTASTSLASHPAATTTATTAPTASL